MRWLLFSAGTLGLLLAGPLLNFATGAVELGGDWRTAPRTPAGLAPDPATTPAAVVQVYAARTFGWRAAFAVHSWIAVKRRDAADYTVYEVIGWRAHHGLPALLASERPPDAAWFGHRPELLAELRGVAAEAAIERIEAAVAAYPYADAYRAWPGPNSNTFTAFVARQVPALRLDLPPTAIGKDYLGAQPFASAPSGTGWQVSLLGLFGVLVGAEEGVEINLLGLTVGIDPWAPAIKIPGLGRFGRN